MLAQNAVQVNAFCTESRISSVLHKTGCCIMSNMYEIILDLCASYGIKPGRVCADTGLSRGIMSDLKMGRTRELSAKNIRIIATYFGVSVDYLLGRGPKIDPLNPTRRIFQVMNEKKMTLKELSAAIELSVDATRAFALGDDVVVEGERPHTGPAVRA